MSKFRKLIEKILENEENQNEILNNIDEFDESSEEIVEDTVKQGNFWVNKGKEGTHGKFKTKKAANAQRAAMFANGYKG